MNLRTKAPTVLIALVASGLLALLGFAPQALAQTLEARAWYATYLFTDQDFTGSTPDTTAWFPIGDSQWFTLFYRLSTNGASFTAEVGDSIEAPVKIELSFDGVRPAASAPGWWEADSTGPSTVTWITTADTLGAAQWWKPLQYQNVGLSPAKWARFIIGRGAKHIRSAKSLKLTIGVFKQP